MKISDETAWKALTFLAAGGAALLTRTALKRGWSLTTGKKPPANPASVDTAWNEALAWTAASSLIAGIARLVAKRQAGHLKRGRIPVLGL
ncbi:MAG: DUF4235 domain-containing protein [Rhodothermaceae bacterium]|nr:DUF4235 domain-containing protein [Rhodothermaceae bacterium]